MIQNQSSLFGYAKPQFIGVSHPKQQAQGSDDPIQISPNI